MKKKSLKKCAAFALTAVLALGAYATPANVLKVSAAEEADSPSISAYATKDQLRTAFAPAADGSAENAGMLSFGYSFNNAQDAFWYIIGEDAGVKKNTGKDNVIILASCEIYQDHYGHNFQEEGVWYDENGQVVQGNILSASAIYTCGNEPPVYEDGFKLENIYVNHYGYSDYRQAMIWAPDQMEVFSDAEKELFLHTTVKTHDNLNDKDYTTSDIMYAPAGKERDTLIKVGTDDQYSVGAATLVQSAAYGCTITLRSPATEVATGTNYLGPDTGLLKYDTTSTSAQVYSLGCNTVDFEVDCIAPATCIDLSDVLFASAVPLNLSADTSSGKITDTAMELRLKAPTSVKLGSIRYDEVNNTVVASRDSAATGNVYAVVQGSYDGKEWYYEQLLSADSSNENLTISSSDIANAIRSELSLSDTITSIDLSKCKIWLETYDSKNGMTYALDDWEPEPVVANVSAPTVSPEPGTYTTAQSITLTSATDGAKIYYTTDGSEPDETTGTEYKAPVTVTGTPGASVTTTIKAIAVKSGMTSSEVQTFVYTIDIPATDGSGSGDSGDKDSGSGSGSAGTGGDSGSDSGGSSSGGSGNAGDTSGSSDKDTTGGDSGSSGGNTGGSGSGGDSGSDRDDDDDDDSYSAGKDDKGNTGGGSSTQAGPTTPVNPTPTTPDPTTPVNPTPTTPVTPDTPAAGTDTGSHTDTTNQGSTNQNESDQGSGSNASSSAGTTSSRNDDRGSSSSHRGNSSRGNSGSSSNSTNTSADDAATAGTTDDTVADGSKNSTDAETGNQSSNISDITASIITDVTSIAQTVKDKLSDALTSILKKDSKVQTGPYVKSDSGNIKVEIPTDLQKAGRTFYLMTTNDNGDIIILPNESTDDGIFEAQGEAGTDYMMIFEDGETPLASMIAENGTLDVTVENNCINHGVGLGIALLALIAAVALARMGKKYFWAVSAAGIALALVAAATGSCSLDWIFFAGEAIVTVAAAVALYIKGFKKA